MDLPSWYVFVCYTRYMTRVGVVPNASIFMTNGLITTIIRGMREEFTLEHPNALTLSRTNRASPTRLSPRCFKPK